MNSSAKASRFPNFLLPSLPLPFRRRRPGSPPAPNRIETGINRPPSPVPSLSSSPTASESEPASPSDADAVSPRGGWGDRNTPSIPIGTIHRPHPDTIRCRTCSADLAFGAQIVSKGFTGRHGRAYLVSPPSSLPTTPVEFGLGLDNRLRPHGPSSRRDAEELDGGELLNISVGKPEPRQLVTGPHQVADISCAVCGTKIGWKYVQAGEASQKYKVGKYILETQRVVLFRPWEDVEDTGSYGGGGGGRSSNEPSPRPSSSTRTSVDSSETGGQTAASDASGDDEMVAFDSEDEDECEDIFAGTWDPAVVFERRQNKIRRQRGKRGC